MNGLPQSGKEWALETVYGPVYKFQIRIRRENPVLVEFTEPIMSDTRQYVEMVLARLRTLVGRTSYVVGGPNAEVWWALDQWNYKAESWMLVVDGKSKLKEGAQAQ